MSNPLLLHYEFDSNGGGENLSDKNINSFFDKKNFVGCMWTLVGLLMLKTFL